MNQKDNTEDTEENNKEIKNKGEYKAKDLNANESTAESTDSKEQILRLIAEFDNYKKRAKRDIDNAKIIGKAELIKNLLPVIDEFDLALMSLSQMQNKIVVKGIELLYSNFIGQLRKEGLEETDSDGVFDPYKHEIMISKQSPKPYGTIIEVVKKGYMFNGIMLRPASVIISDGNGNKKDGKETEDKNITEANKKND